MSVIVIGDQGVGKTTLMLELAKFPNGNVQVISPSFEDLKIKFTNNDQIIPTDSTSNEWLKLRVNLYGYVKQFTVNWIDTKGEAWRPCSHWQKNNLNEWKSTLLSLQNAQAVMIIMAPPRDSLQEELLSINQASRNDERFRKKSHWRNRFQEWIVFLRQNCHKKQLIVICLNMADLFCNINQFSQSLGDLKKIKWYIYKEEILQHFFLREAIDLIEEYDRGCYLPIQLFITTYKNRTMLEMPWLYLSTYL